MLRNHSDKTADYRRRLDVLVDAGILELPDLKNADSRGRFACRQAFDELSFLFFVAWLYTSIWNRSKDSSFRVSWVLLPGLTTTILSLGRRRHPFVLPGTTSKPALLIDDQFFACMVDQTKVAADRKSQILCPVLNRVRLNLGHSDVAALSSLPPSSRDCCGSIKQKFWDFIGGDLQNTRITTGAAIGGQALPVALSSDVATKFATGLESTSTDLGIVFEETLLVYALIAADAVMGLAHFQFKQPFETHEIDFAIYDTKGYKVSDDWKKKVTEQNLCAWEVTCGHLAEDPDVGNDERHGSQFGPGSDHPHKKLVNFLALKSLGFANLHFHYLSILPGQKISPATSQALENTEGFTYWCLGSAVPDLEQHILLSLEAGLDPLKLRGWHRQLVDHVEQDARRFAAACLPQTA